MEKRAVLTKFLAVAGTALAWFPIIAPVLLSMFVSIRGRIFRFDYLMPAELFAFALAGGGLLFWAAQLARSYRRLIGWGLGIAMVTLFGGQAIAVATGLASGEIEPGGWSWALVLASIIAYTLSVIAVGIGGILLIRDISKTSHLS
jgi:hypothetical protein